MAGGVNEPLFTPGHACGAAVRREDPRVMGLQKAGSGGVEAAGFPGRSLGKTGGPEGNSVLS